jgi:ribonuclease HII
MYRRCGFRYEKKLRALGVVRIAGIDEAGRGALAGPVVAAAVILPEKFRHQKLKDSKQLLPELRQEIYDELVSREDISSTANRDHRWRLHQSFHCRRERDRESDAGSFNA